MATHMVIFLPKILMFALHLLCLLASGVALERPQARCENYQSSGLRQDRPPETESGLGPVGELPQSGLWPVAQMAPDRRPHAPNGWASRHTPRPEWQKEHTHPGKARNEPFFCMDMGSPYMRQEWGSAITPNNSLSQFASDWTVEEIANVKDAGIHKFFLEDDTRGWTAPGVKWQGLPPEQHGGWHNKWSRDDYNTTMRLMTPILLVPKQPGTTNNRRNDVFPPAEVGVLWLGGDNAECNVDLLAQNNCWNLFSAKGEEKGTQNHDPRFNSDRVSHDECFGNTRNRIEPWEEVLFTNLKACCIKINNKLLAGESVLVFCHQGARRAATVAGVFMMAKCNLTANQAMEFLKRLRGMIEPECITGFRKIEDEALRGAANNIRTWFPDSQQTLPMVVTETQLQQIVGGTHTLNRVSRSSVVYGRTEYQFRLFPRIEPVVESQRSAGAQSSHETTASGQVAVAARAERFALLSDDRRLNAKRDPCTHTGPQPARFVATADLAFAVRTKIQSNEEASLFQRQGMTDEIGPAKAKDVMAQRWANRPRKMQKMEDQDAPAEDPEGDIKKRATSRERVKELSTNFASEFQPGTGSHRGGEVKVEEVAQATATTAPKKMPAPKKKVAAAHERWCEYGEDRTEEAAESLWALVDQPAAGSYQGPQGQGIRIPIPEPDLELALQPSPPDPPHPPMHSRFPMRGNVGATCSSLVLQVAPLATVEMSVQLAALWSCKLHLPIGCRLSGIGAMSGSHTATCISLEFQVAQAILKTSNPVKSN